jgi:hypothetical protein
VTAEEDGRARRHGARAPADTDDENEEDEEDEDEEEEEEEDGAAPNPVVQAWVSRSDPAALHMRSPAALPLTSHHWPMPAASLHAVRGDPTTYRFGSRTAELDAAHFGGEPRAGVGYLRVATLNCERQLGNAIKHLELERWAAQHELDALAVTEPGALPPADSFGGPNDDEWKVYTPPAPEGAALGKQYVPLVALFLHRRLWTMAVGARHDTEDARAVAVVLGGGAGRSARPLTVIGAAYLPTNLDVAAEGAEDRAIAQRVHDKLRAWADPDAGVGVAVYGGDFNETRDADDRQTWALRNGAAARDGTVKRRRVSAAARVPEPQTSRRLFDGDRDERSRPPCLVDELCVAHGFTDASRVHHAVGTAFTCGVPGPAAANEQRRRTMARLDYLLTRDLRRDDDFAAISADGTRAELAVSVAACAVLPASPVAAWPSVLHVPLIALLRGAFSFDAARDGDGVDVSDHPPRREGFDMRRATEEQRDRAVAMAAKRAAACGRASKGAPPQRSLVDRAKKDLQSGAQIDVFTAQLVALVEQACTATLPTFGGARPRNSKWARTLDALRMDLRAARHHIDPHRGAVVSAEQRARACKAAGRYELACRLNPQPGSMALPARRSDSPPSTDSAAEWRRWLQHMHNAVHDASASAAKAMARAALDQRRAAAKGPTRVYDAHAPLFRQARNMRELQTVMKGRRAPPISAVAVDGGVQRNPQAVADAFREAYARTFAPSADRDEARRPKWWTDAVGTPKATIDARWWDGITAPVTDDDLLAAVNGVSWTTAAGDDRIGAGVWRAMIEGSPVMRLVLRLWATACMACGHRPAHGALTLIVPIGKRAKGAAGAAIPAVGDTRPIALQSALVKLVSKIWARRISTVLAERPILHAEQFAFKRGSGTHHAITALLDVCERARAEGGSAYLTFYDFKGAFDTVRHDDIVPALRRLKLPDAYLAWVTSSLGDLRACVRVGGAKSASLAVRRGVPQGGPESPIQFIAVLDPLAAVLHTVVNQPPSAVAGDAALPRLPAATVGDDSDAKRGGGRRAATDAERLALVGDFYADDVNTCAKTRAAQVAQNEEVKVFAAWHDGVLHPTKTVASGFTTGADGRCTDARHDSDADRAASAQLAVQAGKPVEWQACGALRHLGVWLSLIDGGASPEAVNSVTRLLHALGGVIEAQKLRAATTVVALNTFVSPKIEHMLHTAQPTAAQHKRWNQLHANVLSRRAGVTMRGNHYLPRPAAVSVITEVALPEHALLTARIADAYFRVNGRDGQADTIAARHELELTLRDEKAAQAAYPLRRMAIAVKAMASVGWRPRILTADERQRALTAPARGGPLSHEAHAAAAERGARVTAHTDGSASSDAGDTATAWAVLFGGEWLNRAAGTPLMDATEEELKAPMLRGAPLFSGFIEPQHSHGSYGAELRAVMEALLRAPRGVPLTISTDSQSAIDAIAAWRVGDDISRTRLRTPLRQLLRPIDALIEQRTAEVAASGSGDALPPVAFTKVQAHSGERSTPALANRLVDCAAKLARAAAAPCEQFDVAHGERWMAIEERVVAAPPTAAKGATTRARAKASRAQAPDAAQQAGEEEKSEYRVVTGDVRRQARRRLRGDFGAAKQWKESCTQARYAANAVGGAELWRAIAGEPFLCPPPPAMGPPKPRTKAAARAARLKSTRKRREKRAAPKRGAAAGSGVRGEHLSGATALVLRLLTDTLQHQAPRGAKGEGAMIWRCDDDACVHAHANEPTTRTARTKGRGADVIVPLTTAHLFTCTAPAVCRARAAGATALARFLRRHAREDSDGQCANAARAAEGDGTFDAWFRASQFALDREPGDDARNDRHAMAAALGAFSATRAKAAMRGGQWRNAAEEGDEDWRVAALSELRALCFETVRRAWAATGASRSTVAAATYDNAPSGVSDYDPRRAGSDRHGVHEPRFGDAFDEADEKAIDDAIDARDDDDDVGDDDDDDDDDDDYDDDADDGIIENEEEEKEEEKEEEEKEEEKEENEGKAGDRPQCGGGSGGGSAGKGAAARKKDRRSAAARRAAREADDGVIDDIGADVGEPPAPDGDGLSTPPPPPAPRRSSDAAAKAAAAASAVASAGASGGRPKRSRRPSARVLAGAGYAPVLALAVLVVAALLLPTDAVSGVACVAARTSAHSHGDRQHSTTTNGERYAPQAGPARWQPARTPARADDRRRPPAVDAQTRANASLVLAGGIPKAAACGDAWLEPGDALNAAVERPRFKRRYKLKKEIEEPQRQVVGYESPGLELKFVGAEKMTAG